MTSKSSFWKYSVWNFKKRLWTFALCVIGCFFMMPVALFVETGIMMRGYSTELLEKNYNWFRYSIINSRIAGGGWYGAMVVAMAVFLALQGFSWINQQSKVDMFKSVPVKSSTRFWCINLNSLLIYVVSFGGNLILANIAASIRGLKESWDQNFFEASVISFLMHLLLFAACYFVVLIAQYLTGNVVLGFFGGAVLLGIEPICLILKDALMDIFFQTHVYMESIFESLGKGVVSPIVAYVGMYKNVSEKWLGFANEHNYGGIWFSMMIMLFQILIYGAAAYVLYQKRPAQTGGKSIIFPKWKPVVKFVIMVAGSLCISVFLARFDSETAVWYGFFGAVCGLLVLQMILQTIMEGDFRESINGKVSFAAAFVVTLIIYFAFALDIAGYDTYLPKAEQIEDFAFVRSGDFAYDLVDETGRYVASNESLLENMRITDETSKEQVLSMLQQEIEAGEYYYQGESDAEFFEMGTAESGEGQEIRFEDDNMKEALYVKFRLKGGREVVRCYWLRKAVVRNCFEEMYELPEYKAAVYPILNDRTGLKLFNRNTLPMVSYYAYNLENNIVQSELLQPTRELFDALKEDTAKRSVETIINQAPIGNLEFAAFPEKFMENYQYDSDVQQFRFSMPIYAEDEATVELLKEMGWYQDAEIKPETIAMITVYQSVNNGTAASKVMQINPGDPLFEQVAEDLVSYDAVSGVADAGTFVKMYYWAEVTIIPEMGNEKYGYYQYSCELRCDKFPIALEKAFENVEADEELVGVG